MIQIDVEDYCHGCSRFDPVVDILTTYSDYAAEQYVRCSHNKECKTMMRYLERKFKKEIEDA